MSSSIVQTNGKQGRNAPRSRSRRGQSQSTIKASLSSLFLPLQHLSSTPSPLHSPFSPSHTGDGGRPTFITLTKSGLSRLPFLPFFLSFLFELHPSRTSHLGLGVVTDPPNIPFLFFHTHKSSSIPLLTIANQSYSYTLSHRPPARHLGLGWSQSSRSHHTITRFWRYKWTLSSHISFDHSHTPCSLFFQGLT